MTHTYTGIMTPTMTHIYTGIMTPTMTHTYTGGNDTCIDSRIYTHTCQYPRKTNMHRPQMTVVRPIRLSRKVSVYQSDRNTD